MAMTGVLPQGGVPVKRFDRLLEPRIAVCDPQRDAGGPVRFLPGRPRLIRLLASQPPNP
jgi:hypothetical protein